MQRKTLTTVETYMEGLRQLEVALAELDQAHATLRDVGMDRYSASRIMGWNCLTIREIYKHTESLLKELQTADCDTCGAPLAMHPVEGCEEWRG